MKSKTEIKIIEIRPCSLVGAAKVDRELYIRLAIPIENLTIYLWNPYSGEDDYDLGERPRKLRSLSKTAKAKNKVRREKYRKSRDRRKSAKNRIAGQQVTETKVGG